MFRLSYIRVVLLVIGVLACALSPAAEPIWQAPPMRMPWQPQQGGNFIRQWLLCGPFTADPATDKSLDTDYLAAQGGEASAAPTDGLTVRGAGGREYRWTAYTSAVDTVDLAIGLKTPARDHTVTYALATIDAPSDTRTLLALGSDDGVAVWVNGQQALKTPGVRPIRVDDDILEIDLKKGPNRLLFKVQNIMGGTTLCARLLDMNTLGVRAALLKLSESADHATLSVQMDSPIYRQLPNLPPATLELVAAGGHVAASQTAPRGSVVRFDIAKLPQGPYEIRCTSASPLGEVSISHTPWYRGDLLAAARQLMASAASAKPDDLTLPMLADLVRTRLGDKLDSLTEVPASATSSIHSAVMEAEELKLAATQPDAQARAHGFVRLAYIDPVDDSPQFCRLYLPAHYDPKKTSKTWPMVVVLHGYDPSNPRYVSGWGCDVRHNALAEKHDVIVLEPYARGNSWYGGIGAADVIRCIEMAEARFPVDRDRVLLTGYSMGGWGVWRIGTRRPDLFAAIAPVYGGADYRASARAEDLAKLSDFEVFVRERDSTLAQAEALWTTPVFINHGDADDMVLVDISRYSSRVLQRWGYNVRYWEHPSRGHGGLGSEDEVMRWFLSLRRVVPTQVRLRAAELKTAQSHWLTVTQRENPMEFITAEARLVAPNVITLATRNALEVALTPSAIVDKTKPLTVLWNNDPPRVANLEGEEGRVVLRASGYEPKGLIKTPALEGPLAEQMTLPFAIVLGTVSSDPVMQGVCRLHAQQVADDWEGWQHTKPRFFLDTAITEQEMARYNLILIGGADANLVTRKLSDRLPLKIQGRTVTLGEQSFDAPDAAVGMIYPNPLNPQRYVVVRAATSPSAQFHHLRIIDAVDFYITDGHIGDPAAGVPAEKVLVASGFFDRNWQVNRRFIIDGDAGLRAKTYVRKVPRYLTAPADVDRLMLSDLLHNRLRGSFGEMARDLNACFRPMTLAGKTYASGLSVAVWQNTPCTGDFDISAASFRHLRATIGMEMTDEALLDPLRRQQAKQTRVFFIVSGDGRQLYRSPAFTWDTKPQDIDVDITGVKMLRIEISGRNPGKGVDSLDWADVRLEK